MYTRTRIRGGLGAALAATLVLVCACGPAVSTASSIAALNETPGISNLLKQRLRTDLLGSGPSPAPEKFPLRLRIVPYDFQSQLQQVDVLAEFDAFAKKLRAHPELVSDVSALPSQYGDSIGASFDGLLKLKDTLKADAFLLVSGRNSFTAATEKQPSFFDWWAHKSYWEADETLEALYIQANSGFYLPSLQAAAKAGPGLVVPDDNSTTSSAYALRHQVEGEAFDHLADALVVQLTHEAADPVTVPSPTQAPSATPKPAASNPLDQAAAAAGSAAGSAANAAANAFSNALGNVTGQVTGGTSPSAAPRASAAATVGATAAAAATGASTPGN